MSEDEDDKEEGLAPIFDLEKVDEATLEVAKGIDLTQKRHELITSNLKAQMARYGQINTENKATLNRELEFPEHALLSITQCARTYRDSSEGYELVLLHLIQAYEEYINNIDSITSVSNVSKKYEDKLNKYRITIQKAMAFKAAYVQRLTELVGQVNYYRKLMKDANAQQMREIGQSFAKTENRPQTAELGENTPTKDTIPKSKESTSSGEQSPKNNEKNISTHSPLTSAQQNAPDVIDPNTIIAWNPENPDKKYSQTEYPLPTGRPPKVVDKVKNKNMPRVEEEKLPVAKKRGRPKRIIGEAPEPEGGDNNDNNIASQRV